MEKSVLVELATEIVSAHLSTTEMSKEQLLEELGEVFNKLAGLAGTEGAEGVCDAAEAKPAMTIKEAFRKDAIYCMICGKGFTTLKKHIKTSHGLEAKEYKKQFGIPAKTALASKNYSESKRQKARDLGLADKLAAGRARKKQG